MRLAAFAGDHHADSAPAGVAGDHETLKHLRIDRAPGRGHCVDLGLPVGIRLAAVEAHGNFLSPEKAPILGWGAGE
jgi:hypothetical protein